VANPAPHAVFRAEPGGQEAQGPPEESEQLVAETRICLTLITQGVTALPNASRRALRAGFVGKAANRADRSKDGPAAFRTKRDKRVWKSADMMAQHGHVAVAQ